MWNWTGTPMCVWLYTRPNDVTTPNSILVCETLDSSAQFTINACKCRQSVPLYHPALISCCLLPLAAVAPPPSWQKERQALLSVHSASDTAYTRTVIVTVNNVVKTNNESGNFYISRYFKILKVTHRKNHNCCYHFSKLVIGDLSVHYSLWLQFDTKYALNWGKNGGKLPLWKNS